MKTKESGMFLVCEACEYCCYLRGPMARAVAAEPPPCPGCGGLTRVTKREPWRQTLGALDHAS